MINKQNLWFLTLFSLILVLSVYYITMPNDLLLSNNSNYTEKEEEVNKEVEVVKEETDVLDALRVNLNEERENEKKELNSLLTDSTKTSEEKNEAYEKLQNINQITGEETNIEKLIKEKFDLKAFVKVESNQVNVVINSTKHDTTLANNIMRLVQENFKNKMYISVQFK